MSLDEMESGDPREQVARALEYPSCGWPKLCHFGCGESSFRNAHSHHHLNLAEARKFLCPVRRAPEWVLLRQNSMELRCACFPSSLTII